MRTTTVHLLPDIYVGAIAHEGRRTPTWVCSHNHGSQAEAHDCAERNLGRQERIRLAQRAFARDGECEHPSINPCDDDTGVCEVCGQVFTYRGLGEWEPVGREQAR